jgi:hypothetical protein
MALWPTPSMNRFGVDTSHFTIVSEAFSLQDIRLISPALVVRVYSIIASSYSESELQLESALGTDNDMLRSYTSTHDAKYKHEESRLMPSHREQRIV